MLPGQTELWLSQRGKEGIGMTSVPCQSVCWWRGAPKNPVSWPVFGTVLEETHWEGARWVGPLCQRDTKAKNAW